MAYLEIRNNSLFCPPDTDLDKWDKSVNIYDDIAFELLPSSLEEEYFLEDLLNTLRHNISFYPDGVILEKRLSKFSEDQRTNIDLIALALVTSLQEDVTGRDTGDFTKWWMHSITLPDTRRAIWKKALNHYADTMKDQGIDQALPPFDQIRQVEEGKIKMNPTYEELRKDFGLAILEEYIQWVISQWGNEGDISSVTDPLDY